jgi:exopolysaccharide biosynthesis polyprenyl glycosylphosphotransferase
MPRAVQLGPAAHRADEDMLQVQQQARSPRRTLIVGAGEAGLELEAHLPEDYAVVGFVEDNPELVAGANGKILGGPEEIAELVRRYEIDEVLIADVLVGHLGGTRYEIPAEAASRQGTADNSLCGESQFLDMPQAVHGSLSSVVKRGFDLLFSLGALVVAAPVAGLAVLAIKLTSPGPVLYRQVRVGRGGRHFTIYKLRTMIEGAEDETGPILARQGDPRSTSLGRILRATKLDEWPQFYNVLQGDMSVVGPRPERPCFVQAYCRHIPAYPQRYLVRPGITGLAQVNGGYLTHVYVKLYYDLMYVYNQSLWLDLWILARTPLTILRSMIGRNWGPAINNK